MFSLNILLISALKNSMNVIQYNWLSLPGAKYIIRKTESASVRIADPAEVNVCLIPLQRCTRTVTIINRESHSFI